MKTAFGLVLGTLIAVAAPTAACADSDSAVAISAKASSSYVRAQKSDGSFEPETFAFGKGGIWAGDAKDNTIDKLDFMDIARTLAVPLAGRGYVPSHNPAATRLLVMVYWGTTHAPEHATNSIASENLQAANAAALAANHAQIARFSSADSCAPFTVTSTGTGYAIQTPEQVDDDNALTGAMSAVAAEDRARDLADARNASLLGYDSAWDQVVGYKGTPLDFRRQELVDELEERRYFVVLMAYDFQMMWKQKKPKLLWEARYSIRDRGNDFQRQLAAMTEEASKYFGRNSGGLVRQALPEGHVEIGPQKILAYGAPK